MAVLTEIRKRPWLLMGAIAIALLAFLVNPDSINKVFGKNPDVLGKVNGDKITREEFNDQLMALQQQAQQQGQPGTGLENQAWNMLVQSKLIQQQFDKMGLKLTDDMFWNQMQYDPMFANNPQFFDDKGNFKVSEVKKQIEQMKNDPNPQAYAQWQKVRKNMEYSIMARQVMMNLTGGITTSQKEATEMIRQRDTNSLIDYVNIDYAGFAQKNPVKVTTQDLADYIKLHPIAFKTEATRNIGLAYFPATPSAADEAAATNEINKLFLKGTDATNGTENFQNTKNDSLFVTTNSDAPFNPGYFPLAQLPAAIKDKMATAAIGQTFGPYKEQNMLVVSKLLAKKSTDSTSARHILISYKGNPAAAGTNRTKEQAKKLADSILTAVKADPAKFEVLAKLSSDKSSAVQGGNLGWSTSTQPKYVPEFEKFVDNSPKGATGEVETQFGYHIINIVDKKTGSQAYKIANLVKTIKPSDATEATVDKNARRFIQQVQGKSFNDFQNLAKKSNYNFQNPRAVKRFDGQLLGTDKDQDIITWAFDKKRNAGDTEFFTVDGSGDRIVAYYNGKQDAGTADPESVRPQIEQLVKNKLLAKKIIEKINSAKISSLDQAAKIFGVAKQSAQTNLLNPQVGTGMEPKVAGAASAVAANKPSLPVEGITGVFLVMKKSDVVNKQPGDAKQATIAISQQKAQMFGQSFMKSLRDNADIDDYRAEVWNQNKQ